MANLNVQLSPLTFNFKLDIVRLGGIQMDTTLVSLPINFDTVVLNKSIIIDALQIWSIGVDGKYEIFLVSDGSFLLFDGDNYKVLRHELQE